jgi:hypothetical protein
MASGATGRGVGLEEGMNGSGGSKETEVHVAAASGTMGGAS